MDDTQAIIAKHASGKKLTKKEVEQLRKANDPPKAAWEKLGLKKAAYYKYKKQGMPTQPAEAQNWLAEKQAMQTQGKGMITIGGNTYTAQDLIDLRGKLLEHQSENLSLKNRIEELNLAEREGRLMDGDQLTETLSRILVPLKKAHDAMPETLATAINPDDPSRAEQILTQELQNIYADLTQTMKKNEQTRPSSY